MAFNKRIHDIVKQFNISDEIGIGIDIRLNWDQTGVKLVPCGEWTMHDIGKILFTFLFKNI